MLIKSDCSPPLIGAGEIYRTYLVVDITRGVVSLTDLTSRLSIQLDGYCLIDTDRVAIAMMHWRLTDDTSVVDGDLREDARVIFSMQSVTTSASIVDRLTVGTLLGTTVLANDALATWHGEHRVVEPSRQRRRHVY